MELVHTLKLSMKSKRELEEQLASRLTEVEATPAKNKADQPDSAKKSETGQFDQSAGSPLSLEELIATISTRFITRPAYEIDRDINYALGLVGEFAAVDRCLVFFYQGDLVSNTHEWCAAGIESQIDRLPTVPASRFSWWQEKMNQLKPVMVRCLADLPAEANAEKVAWEGQKVQSVAAIPLVHDESLLGYLRLDAVAAEKSWSDKDVALLKAIGKIFAGALGRKAAEAERLAGNERLLHELTILHTIAASIEATSENELIERFTRLIGETLQPDNFGVVLLDEAKNVLRVHPSYEGPRRAVPVGRGVVGTVAATGRAWRVADVSHEPIYLKVDRATQSELCVPLKIGKRVIGVVNVESRAVGAFSEADERLLVTLASQLATGLEKIRLFHETAEALLREQQLNEITRTLSSALDLPSILIVVVQMATDLIGAHAGLLGLVIDNQIMTFYPYNVPSNMSLRPTMKGRGVAWQIVESGETLVLDNYAEHPNAERKWIDVGIQAFLGVPITAGERCLGTLILFNLYTDKPFTERDQALAESVGRQAGTAIQNIRMYAEAQQRASALAAALARQEELDTLKNRFIHSVSHELRTPLGIIYGHAELLDSGDLGQLLVEQAQSVNIIARRAQMLTNLVDDLSTLLAAETQELRREAIDPAQLIYSMLADYRMKAEEASISLKADIAEALPWLMGDTVHLRRVFDNLVSNAFKFTPAGGSVTLRMAAEEQDVILEVADTGAGIPAEKLPRIFERFYQVEDGTARRHVGTGLGLALVKEIVEAHRGRIAVESEIGKGTTFRIVLPGYKPIVGV